MTFPRRAGRERTLVLRPKPGRLQAPLAHLRLFLARPQSLPYDIYHVGQSAQALCRGVVLEHVAQLALVVYATGGGWLTIIDGVSDTIVSQTLVSGSLDSNPTETLSVDSTNGRVYLGQEIGRAEGRNVRHRMFGIVDRSVIDSYFLSTTAQNVLDGHGFVYNPQDGPVEAYSDFLHVWVAVGLLGFVRAIGADKVTVFFLGKGLSLAFGLGILWLTRKLLERLGLGRGASLVAGLAFVALFLISPPHGNEY